MRRSLPTWRAAAAGVIALIASFAIAACGGSRPSGAETVSASTGKAVKFATCMRANGVPDYPDPGAGTQTIGPNDLSESARVVQKATNACQRDSPVTHPPASSAQLAKLRVAALAYAKCMRSHGVSNFPDPTVSNVAPYGAGISAPGPAVATEPSFKAANETCSSFVNAPGLPGVPSKKG